MTRRFDGLKAVVTGGASGIGLSTAVALSDAGAGVAVLDVNATLVEAPLLGFVADLADRGSTFRAMESAARQLGGVDILINNAGISAIGTVEEVSDADCTRVLDINVTGMIRSSAAALPFLRQSSAPVIINLCSVGALNGLPRRALYNASKGAVLSLTYAMATDYVVEGIRVNAVSPGTVRTPFVENYLTQFTDPDTERAQLAARQATGRMVEPEEVADAVLYLAHPAASSTTGTVLEVDGGITHLRVRK